MTIIDYFQQLTQIPHCSYQSEQLKFFLTSFAKERDFDIEIDEVGNILVSKGEPKLCFQAHYDMVCVGRAPKLQTYIKDGWMYAKESTLGADNGMAIAMMMALMDEGHSCEYLFTADEEVGLIGANALAFSLQSQYMLNLDSEDEAEVYIGCAGGVDIFGEKQYNLTTCEKQFYEITISGLPGGHSGVEIHKNIPNAIKLFATYCQDKEIKIATIDAGERINSIPVHVKAIVASDQELVSCEYIDIHMIDQKFDVITDSNELIALLANFQNGVLAFNDDLEVPDRSINLALLSLKDGKCCIEVSARAMDQKGLEKTEIDTKNYFEKFVYSVKSEGKYPAWKPQINDFAKLVYKQTQEIFGRSEYKAIHAGLECAVISDLYPHIQITSIGPNIRSPHSVSECVELASVDKVYEVVSNVIAKVNSAV